MRSRSSFRKGGRMRKIRVLNEHVIIIVVLAMAWLAASVACAETIELVTYYPAPSTPDQHLRSLTVGTPYATVAMDDKNGWVLIYDRLGIGTTNPLGPLHVVGYNDQLSSVLFVPGQDTTADGRPDIRVGIGSGFTAANPPQALLHIRHEQDAAYIRLEGNGGADENFSALELRSVEGTPKVWQMAHKKGGAGGLNDFQVSYYDGAAWNLRLAIKPNGSVGIGTPAPSASAMVEVSSTTQGFLPPRMTSVQRRAIPSPAIGLEVFDTTAGVKMFWNSVRWQEVGAPPVGTIIAWHPDFPNPGFQSNPPWGWVRCNGQVLSDSESPYNGRTMPSLNSATQDGSTNSGMFLRGGPASGVAQADATAANGLTLLYTGNVSGGACPYAAPYYVCTTSAPIQGAWIYSNDTDTRPANMTVVWIIRVK